jgi:hypothetical protein
MLRRTVPRDSRSGSILLSYDHALRVRASDRVIDAAKVIFGTFEAPKQSLIHIPAIDVMTEFYYYAYDR